MRFITPRSAIHLTFKMVVAYRKVGLSTPACTQKLSSHDKINVEKIIPNDVAGPDFILRHTTKMAQETQLKSPNRFTFIDKNVTYMKKFDTFMKLCIKVTQKHWIFSSVNQ